MATYYVATTGDDDNPGTIGSPWATWNFGFTQLSAGDTLYIRGGTYYPTGVYGYYFWEMRCGVFVSGVNGTALNPINVYNYPGETPVLDCRNITANFERGGIVLYNCDYWHLKGLTVTRVDQEYVDADHIYGGFGFDCVYCNYLTLELCVSHDNGGSGYRLGYDSEGNTYLNCDAHDNYDQYTGGYNGDGFDISYITYRAGSPRVNYISGCRSWNNSDDGFDHYDNDAILFIDKCWAWHNGFNKSGSTPTGDGNGFKLGIATNITVMCRYVTNCLAWDNQAGGFTLEEMRGLCTIYNSVAYANGSGGGWEAGFQGWTAYNIAHVLYNNISYDNASGDTSQFGTNYDDFYNTWNGGYTVTDADFVSVSWVGASGARQADGSLPLLTFLHLESDSDLVAGGDDVGLFDDGDGRLWKSPPSLGAFEYYSETSPPTSPPITSPPITSPPYEPEPEPELPSGCLFPFSTIFKKIFINRCTEGIYLRWWFNGWHYFNFTNGYEIEMKTESQDIQVLNFFSVISKVERDTRVDSEYSYRIELHGITPQNIEGFKGLLLAEYVEQYEQSVWREINITRGGHLIKEEGTNGYILEFEITRDEIPDTSSVYHKTLRLYIGDTLCDMDDDEVIPINKQVNNIAELQDRNTDFTASFKILKTRAMKALFELSGEVGATTTFPYERQYCRLVQDNIEIITDGILVLDRVDDKYYHVSIMSGNINFFNLIAKLKLTDLSLPDCAHTWDAEFMALTHLDTSPGINVVYPLCEPTDDGSAAPLTDDGDKVEMYGGWIWPFIRLQTIWEEIFANAGFTVTGGDIIGSDIFSKLYLPIASREITDVEKYLYSVWWSGTHAMTGGNELLAFSGAVLVKGDEQFRTGTYTTPYTATYKYTVWLIAGTFMGTPPTLYLVNGITIVATFTLLRTDVITSYYEVEYDAVAGEVLGVWTTPIYYFTYSIQVADITDAKIDYSSFVEPQLYLPDMSQTDFVKMVCHLFGLVPEVTPRDRKIRFWNYRELYDNFFQARDWSNYLSERDDLTEFQFGGYGQKNYLKFKQCDDVILDTGKGELPVEDETLPEENDMIQLAMATCDEVRILDNVFPVDVSRIAFNKWNDDDGVFDSEDSIDPRVVYIDHCREVLLPPYGDLYQKEFWIRPTETPLAGIFAAPSEQVLTPKVAQSFEISFANLIYYYASLSRMLTKTNVRKAKFNLPVYEVAGLKHNIPIYLSQYKAYFYVNKISNYIAGKLCTVELIKL